MPLLEKHYVAHRDLLRDARPVSVRLKDYWGRLDSFCTGVVAVAITGFFLPDFALFSDAILILLYFYTRWFFKQKLVLPFKMPKYAAPLPDHHNPRPGSTGAGPSEGILYLGNVNEADNPGNKQEIWLTNNDARTHILFIGTTGSGKTEGLKSIVSNALTWGSGFVYIDGKADTDLWASLYALARRFGRDDDLLVLNYMTANSDDGAVSNTMNPFSNGSASYLTNMVTNLMPDAGGDNAMWKERAVALLGALMPALTWKRDKGGMLLDVSVLREYIELPAIIKLSRDPTLPERIIKGLQGYLNTLPGYIDAAFDDEGNEKPPAPDQPMYDLQVARQQHGYLSMQFTRSLQSLGDEYGYIFKAQLADIDVLDVVLNRRILVGLIPSLEKSGDEAANLGKIVAASLKGMMGATLGNTVEGSWENAIGSKQTRSSSSFMTVFDEVGYYTAQGMAVMAAQARSLGFSLIFAAQDLPSMEKRVKQEAQSILANCNLKIFGKLEDPGDTKKFFQDHVGQGFVYEQGGMTAQQNTISSLFMNKPFYDNMNTGGITTRDRAHYDHLRGQREGEVHMLFSEYIAKVKVFYAVPDKVRALRVHKLLPVPGTTTLSESRERMISEVAARLKDANWTAENASKEAKASPEILALQAGLEKTQKLYSDSLESAVATIGGLDGALKNAPATTVAPASPAEEAPAPMAAVPQKPSSPLTFSMPMEVKEEQREEAPKESFDDLEVEPLHDILETKVSGTYVPQDIDISVVPRASEEEGPDVTKLDLPEDLSSFIEGMADKLNKGMAEKEASKED